MNAKMKNIPVISNSRIVLTQKELISVFVRLDIVKIRVDLKQGLKSNQFLFHLFNLVIKSDKCFDINECMTNPCIVPFECENTDGSYICECAAGYERDEGDICRNIDECERDELAENNQNICPEKGKGITESLPLS